MSVLVCICMTFVVVMFDLPVRHTLIKSISAIFTFFCQCITNITVHFVFVFVNWYIDRSVMFDFPLTK